MNASSALFVRSIAGILASAALSLALIAAWGPLAPAQAKSPVKIGSFKKSPKPKTGSVKVIVKSKKAARVKVSGAGKSAGLFRRATVRFKRGGKKTVRLKLTAKGKKQLSRCGAHKVKLKGKWTLRKRAARGKSRGTTRTTRKIRKHKSRCTTTVTVPLGDNPERCDFLDPTECLQPFANDYFTRPDGSTGTGKRLNLDLESAPANTKGVHIAVTHINRGDGFSPGNMILLKIPGLDTPAAFENSGLVPITDTGAYDDPDQSVIVIDADTGERHPIWAELDSNPSSVDPTDTADGGINVNPGDTDEVNLIVRPTRNFEYGHRYIVIFRDLRDAADQPIEAPLAFRAYRDGLKTNQELVEQRRAHMNSVINDAVDKGGVERNSLYMAWDFTVASRESVTGRALQIRDDAFERLGDNNLADRVVTGDSPEVEIVNVCDKYEPGGGPDCGGAISQPDAGSDVRRVIEARLLDMPCYLNQDGCLAGGTFDFAADGKVDFNPDYTMDVPIRCFIPESIQPGGRWCGQPRQGRHLRPRSARRVQPDHLGRTCKRRSRRRKCLVRGQLGRILDPGCTDRDRVPSGHVQLQQGR